VIIVASVSAIYGIGDPSSYYGMLMKVEPGQKIRRDELIKRLVELLYERSDIEFERGTFRVRGDVVEIYPSYQDQAYRIELWAMRSTRSPRSIPCWVKCSRNMTSHCPSIRNLTT
jgi:excinuclease ABC subunit B